MTHRLTAQVQPDGSLFLSHVPFPPGATVEVAVTEQDVTAPTDKDRYPYHGIQIKYLDPFEPAVPPEDWDVYR